MNSASTSSGLLAASAAVTALPGRLKALNVIPDGTNAAIVTIYDNPSAASGSVLLKIRTSGTVSESIALDEAGVNYLNGLYAEISGTGAACVVHFCPG